VEGVTCIAPPLLRVLTAGSAKATWFNGPPMARLRPPSDAKCTGIKVLCTTGFAVGLVHCPKRYAQVAQISLQSPYIAGVSGFSANRAGGRTRHTKSACSTEGSRMGEFAATLHVRLREAHASLRAALAAGDADLTDTQLDEIEHLRGIAAAHGIAETALA
jgi:hypothetical protein